MANPSSSSSSLASPSSPSPPSLEIGVELGSETCRAAIFHEGKISVIGEADKDNTPLPAFVYITEDGEELVGTAAKTMSEKNHHRGINVGALMGLIGQSHSAALKANIPANLTLVEHGNERPGIAIAEKIFLPEQLVGLLLRYLRQNAEAWVGKAVMGAVIIIHTGVNHIRLSEGLREAGRNAGFSSIRTLSSTHAALLWYDFSVPANETNLLLEKGSRIFVLDFELEGNLRFAFSELEVGREGENTILSEVKTSPLGLQYWWNRGDFLRRRRKRKCADEHPPDRWLVVGWDEEVIGWIQTQMAKVESDGAIISKLLHSNNFILRGAALYAAIGRSGEEELQRIRVDAAIPRDIWFVYDDMSGTPSNTGVIIPKYTTYDTPHVSVAVLHYEPAVQVTELDIWVYEGEMENNLESQLLGTIKIRKFGVNASEKAVILEFTAKLSYGTPSTLQLSAICETSGFNCEVEFHTNWLSRGPGNKENMNVEPVGGEKEEEDEKDEEKEEKDDEDEENEKEEEKKGNGDAESANSDSDIAKNEKSVRQFCCM